MNDELKNISSLFESGIKEVFIQEKIKTSVNSQKRRVLFWDFVRHRVVGIRIFWKKIRL